MGICKNRFSKKEILKIFLWAAFPIHAWAIILVLKDFQWVYDQLGMSTLIGYASYSLVFAFFESVIFLILLWLFSYLLPKRWVGEKKLSLLALWAFVISSWAVCNQVFYLLLESQPEFMSSVLHSVYYHQGLVFSLLIVLVFSSVILPLILILRFDNFITLISDLIERIATLSAVYLIFDFLGFIIIIARNLTQ